MSPAAAPPSRDSATPDRQRIDQWLWFSRVTPSRTLAATLVAEGKVRLNGDKVDKPSTLVKSGDTLTVVMRQQVRILTVRAFAARRGSAAIAATLFDDLTPPPPTREERALEPQSDAHREAGSGRPTKRQRRDMERLKWRST